MPGAHHVPGTALSARALNLTPLALSTNWCSRYCFYLHPIIDEDRGPRIWSAWSNFSFHTLNHVLASSRQLDKPDTWQPCSNWAQANSEGCEFQTFLEGTEHKDIKCSPRILKERQGQALGFSALDKPGTLEPEKWTLGPREFPCRPALQSFDGEHQSTPKRVPPNKLFIHYTRGNLNSPSDGCESSLSQTNLIFLLSRVMRLGDQRNATDIWYLDFSKPSDNHSWW